MVNVIHNCSKNYVNYVYIEDLVVNAEWNNCRVL